MPRADKRGLNTRARKSSEVEAREDTFWPPTATADRDTGSILSRLKKSPYTVANRGNKEQVDGLTGTPREIVPSQRIEVADCSADGFTPILVRGIGTAENELVTVALRLHSECIPSQKVVH